uniref:Uncharacterized protein n=1 Tax=Malurus cyaneus samueli TaxID=2593467 RepID=A0A8C5U2F5_9PASS
MASFRIRQYRDQDYEAVRALFARGILEHAPAGFRHVLRSARVRLALLAVFVAARAAAGSWVLGLGAVALALVLLWVLVRSLSAEYVREALGTDLCDVPGTYLRPPDRGFWVAEFVVALPSDHLSKQKSFEGRKYAFDFAVNLVAAQLLVRCLAMHQFSIGFQGIVVGLGTTQYIYLGPVAVFCLQRVETHLAQFFYLFISAYLPFAVSVNSSMPLLSYIYPS